jgi:hypothetical protein
MKGIIFAGCSFTWGQGLYYYSDMDNVIPQVEGTFHPSKLTKAHILYKDILRFPRLVANHFNTFEVVKDSNGGSDDMSMKFVDTLFNGNGIEGKFNHCEIDYIIFQTSQIVRNGYKFEYNGVIRNRTEPNGDKILTNWLVQNNISYDEWFNDYFCKRCLENIKKFFILYEEKGIKCRVLCWQNDLLPYIKNDEYMNGRFITLNQYDSIDDLIKNNDHMLISNDYLNFTNPIDDRHPSKLCHQIIAQNIIKNIEKK